MKNPMKQITAHEAKNPRLSSGEPVFSRDQYGTNPSLKNQTKLGAIHGEPVFLWDQNGTNPSLKNQTKLGAIHTKYAMPNAVHIHAFIAKSEALKFILLTGSFGPRCRPFLFMRFGP
jgi:hypothetical protein